MGRFKILTLRGFFVALCAVPLICQAQVTFQEYPIPKNLRAHDVWADAAAGGPVYFSAQGSGHLGILDPKSGKVETVPLGRGSSPHGVIMGPDGGVWLTDGGQNAIVRVDPRASPNARQVKVWELPPGTGYMNLNTATFDGKGLHWFTGQSGVYGRLDPRMGSLRVFRAPGGPGPYGIATTPGGQVWYASLAGSHIARVDLTTGRSTIVRPPTAGQGARRIWSDSHGRLWVSEWNAGRVARYEPSTRRWREWKLPGSAQPYAVYVDDRDVVWLTDFGASAIVRFDPAKQRFVQFRLRTGANVRQLLGRPGIVWGAESGADRLVSISSR